MFRHITTRVSGLIILIAGIWGGLIPFVGPYFHFVLGPDQHWKWTTGRLWLNVLPGAVAVLGGLILMGGGPRVSGRFGALLALAAGIWFIVGPDVSMLWNHGHSQAGTPYGTNTFKRFLEMLTFHSGLGALITTFAAYSIPGAATYVAGRRARPVRDAELAGGGAAAGAAAEHHHDRRVAEREGAVGAGTAGAGAAGTGAGAAGTGAAGTGAGTAARAPLADREATAGQPLADREATAGQPIADREAATGAPGTAGEAPAGGAGYAGAGNGIGAQPAAQTTRRRGGLAGLFSRR
jgi:hypothetical protein